MRKSNIRVAIDTNVWISFLIGKMLSGLSKAIANNNVMLLFSEELFDEVVTVLHRPKFKRYFSDDDIMELICLLEHKVEKVKISEHFNDCRDPKDNFLLDLCMSGEADYLVTGDNDLLTLHPFHGIQIINYQTFNEILKTFKQ